MGNEVELIVCTTLNARFAQSVLNNNLTLGSKAPEGISQELNSFIEFTDQDWKNPNKNRYINFVAKIKPRISTVLDLERPEQFNEVIEWAEEIAPHVQESIVIIPKYDDVISAIPMSIGGKEIRLGYSIQTNFGGTNVVLSEFRKAKHKIHLLGGSPSKQVVRAKLMNVASVDCNTMILAATKCQILTGLDKPKWVHYKDYFNIGELPDALHICFDESCKNMIKLWRRRGFKLSGKLAE